MVGLAGVQGNASGGGSWSSPIPRAPPPPGQVQGTVRLAAVPKSHFKPHIAREPSWMRASAGSVISEIRDFHPGKP